MGTGTFRRALLGAIVACSFLGVVAAPAFAGTSSEIEALPTLDALNRSENPLSNSGKWSALAWDNSGSGHNTGIDLTEGWAPYDAYSTVNGAFWNPSAFSDQSGDAASITMQTGPGTGGRYVALWLDMSSPGSTKTGYQLRLAGNSGGGTYTVTLSKWSSGSGESNLASNTSLSIAAGTTMAISDTGSTVTAWKGSGGSMSALLSASDSTYSSGYAGIEGSGNTSRSTNFKAGSLMPSKLANLPVTDTLRRSETTLSNGEQWGTLNWAEGTNKPGKDTTEGWSASDAFPKVNGAFWKDGTLSDASGWAAASLTMAKAPNTYEHSTAVWLDMPNPGSVKSGYSLRWRMNWDTTTYTLDLDKWVSGTRTNLAWEYVNIAPGQTLALVDEGSTVSAWEGSGGSLSKVLSASDSAYSSGYAGIEGAGTVARSVDFRVGTLLSAKVANLPVTDTLSRTEEPLSNGGKWTTLNWAEGSQKAGKDTSEGWTPVDGFPKANGAYWNPGAFSDASGWDAATLTLNKSPGTYEHRTRVWLDMPSPGSAKSGYSLTWAMNLDTVTYTLELDKWVSGAKTNLTWAYEHIYPGQTLALVDEGGTVSAYRGQTKALSASDSTYSSGYAGIEGAGTVGRSTNFKVGTAATSTDAPDTTIAAGSSAGLVPPNVAFSFTSNEASSTFECSIDGGTYSACSSPKSYNGLTEATHAFRVRAVSAAGTDQTPAERSVEVVSAEKAITKTALRDALLRNESPMTTSTFSKMTWATELGELYAEEPGKGWGAKGSNAGAYWNPTTFSSSENGAMVAATVGYPVSWSGERDALWLHMPSPGSAKSGYEARFEGSASNLNVELSKWVGEKRTVLASTSNYVLPSGNTIALSDAGGNLTLWTGKAGSFSQVLTAFDSTYTSGYAGVEVNGAAPQLNNFRAGNGDLVAPNTTIASGPSGSKVFPDVSFTFTSTEQGSFECSMDGSAYGSCPSPKEYHALAVGSHTFRVRAVDLSGNQDPTPAERTFSVVEPPQTTITSAQPSYTSHETPPIMFSSSKAGSTFQCSLNGATYTSCTSPYTLPSKLEPAWNTFRVKATDTEGNTDPTPAEWTFNLNIYPLVKTPATSKLISPEEGRKSSHYFTLQSEWGNPPEGGGITGVTFQMKLSYWDEFKTIPAKYVLNGKGEQVTWPLAVSSNPGHSEAVYFNYLEAVIEEYGLVLEKDIKFRAIFDGGTKAAGASEPVTTEFTENFGGAGAPSDATESIGPASLDLLTGQYTISKTDVSITIPGTESNLEFTRVYNSNYRGQAVPSSVLSSAWQPSVPVEMAAEGEAWTELRERHENAVPAVYDEECLAEGFPAGECLVEEEIPAADWIELLENGEAGASFEIQGGNYIAPEYMKEYTLVRHGEGAGTTFELTNPEGVHTVFVRNEVGLSGSYRVDSVSWQATSKSARMVYKNTGGEMRLSKMIAPAPEGVPCTDAEATKTKGCRTLTFQYIECELSCGHDGWSRLSSITYYNSSGEESQAQPVARYEYDSKYRLAAEWDPRISPSLKETYTYGSAYGTSCVECTTMLSLTPPGAEPWNFEYYNSKEFKYEGGTSHYGWRDAALMERLKCVKRASLVESSPTAQTTIVYQVPLSGEGAPYGMSPSAVEKWGQTDYPVDATAIFPPTQVPGTARPTDFSEATVHYLDPEGYEVNTASPGAPGVEGSSIATSETNRHGDVVRTLDPQGRLEALKAKEPIGRSHELDSHSVYSEDGTEMLESWGPLHKVRLESGKAVEARQHTTVSYDANAPELKEGETAPRLPTKETTGASIPGQSEDVETSVTETAYEWPLRKPKEQIVDPSGLNLHTKTVYEPSTGLVTESRMPANTEGGDAHTTKTAYYTKATQSGELSACGSHAAWAGLPCVTYPASAPSPAESNPQMPWTWYSAYSKLDQPEKVEEKTNGVLKRTTIFEYDSAGRPIETKVTGDGTPVPASKTNYDPNTGAVTSQELVCEAPESCTSFDSQKLTTTYDKLGRPKKYEDADGNPSGTAYDLLGRPVIVTDGKGAQEVRYDEKSGLPVEMTDSAAGVFKATYNADGQLTEQLLPDGLAQQITYDAPGAAVGLRYQKVDCSSSCTWLEFNREDSIGGQVLKETSTLGTSEYSYDKAGRLTLTKETPAGAGEGCTTRAYTFDKDTNRLSKTVRGPKSGGACDTESVGIKTSYKYDTADRLVGEGVEYDNLGRITALPSTFAGGSKLTTSYYVNNLTRSQTQEGLTNTYYLDASRRQRESVQSGTKSGTEVFHYAGGSDSPAWTQEGSNWSRNISALGGGLGAIQKSTGETTLQLADMHADVIASAALAPTETKLISTQRFDEFGNPLQSGPLKGGSAEYGWLGSRARRTQLPSGVVQMGERSYVPALGRFLSPDPIKGGSANAYDYADQDPVNQFDLTGEAASCVKERGRCKGHQVTEETHRIERRNHRVMRKNHIHTEPVGGCHGRGSCEFYLKRGGSGGPDLGALLHAINDAVNHSNMPLVKAFKIGVEGYIHTVEGKHGGIQERSWACANDANEAASESAEIANTEIGLPAAYGYMITRCIVGFGEG